MPARGPTYFSWDPVFQPENHSITDGAPALGAVCDDLNAYYAGRGPYDHEHPFKWPTHAWKLFGIQNSHNGKLGNEAVYSRAPARSNLDGIDSPDQRNVLNHMTAGLTGVTSSAVPDVASLLISPVVRGAGVTVQ